MNTNLGGKFFILLAAFGAAITLGATVTHAGFEWVPPTQPAAAPEVTPAAPNVTVAPGIPPAARRLMPCCRCRAKKARQHLSPQRLSLRRRQ
jgi:hypothetical protein